MTVGGGLTRSVLVGALAGALIFAAYDFLFFDRYPRLHWEFDSDRPPPSGTLRGFYPSERSPEGLTFAWTAPAAELVLKDLDRRVAWAIALRVGSGGRPEASTPPSVTITIDGVVARRWSPSSRLEEVVIEAPPEGNRRGLTLGIETSPVYVPGRRRLGVVVDAISISPRDPVSPPQQVVLATTATGALLGAGFGLAGFTRLALLAALAGVGLAHQLLTRFGAAADLPHAERTAWVAMWVAVLIATGMLIATRRASQRQPAVSRPGDELPPARMPMIRGALVLGLALGTAWNLSFASNYRDTLSCYNLGLDTTTYDPLAWQLAQSVEVRDIPPSQPPGFLLFLASLYRLFGHAYFPVKVTFCFLILAMGLMNWWLGKRYLSEPAGVLAALATVYSPMLRAYASTLQYEILAAFLLLAATTLTLWGASLRSAPRSRLVLALAALVSAIGALTREVLVVAFPLMLLYYAIRGAGPRREKSFTLALMGCLFIVLVGGWISWQYVQVGHLVPVSEKAPINFLMGNNPNANGTYHLHLAPVVEPYGWSFIREHPLSVVRLAGRKILYFWGIDKDQWNVPRPAAVVASRMFLNALNLEWWLVLARGGALALFFFVGLSMVLSSRLRLDDLWLLPALVFAVMGVHLIHVASHRYAVPILPLAFLVASIPAARLGRWLLKPPRRGLLVIVALVIWASLVQFGSWPGTYAVEAEDLEGWMVDNVGDEGADNGGARYADPARGSRLMAYLTHEFLPRGFIAVGLDVRRAPRRLEPTTELAHLRVYAEGGALVCASPITEAQFSGAGYERISTICHLPDDQVIRVEVQTLARTEVWLDRLLIDFGYSSRKDVMLP